MLDLVSVCERLTLMYLNIHFLALHIRTSTGTVLTCVRGVGSDMSNGMPPMPLTYVF